MNSIYLRLLALNPAARGHNLNVGVAGTAVNELLGQADQALAANPLPELFLIHPSDGAHLTVAGLRKQAALEGHVLGLGS